MASPNRHHDDVRMASPPGMVFAADGTKRAHEILQLGKLLKHEREKEMVPGEGVLEVYFGLPPGRLKLQFPCTVPLKCGVIL